MKLLKNIFLPLTGICFFVGGVVTVGESEGLKFVQTSFAQEAPPQPKLDGCKNPPEKRPLKTLPRRFHKKVEKVDAILNPEIDPNTETAPDPNYKEAWPLIEKLVERCDDCTKYEWAQLYQRAAIVQYNLENLSGAIKYFIKVVEQAPEIPTSLETQLLYQIAQLLTAEEKYKEALTYFSKWEAMCPAVVPSNYYYFRAQNYYQLGDKTNALKEITRAIENARAAGNIPDEPWLRMQFAIFYDKEDFKKAEKVAEEIVVNYFSPRSVRQLASVYGTNGKLDRQAALLDALFQTNDLATEGELKNLAYTYLEKEVPYLASRVLKKGFKDKKIERTERNLNVYSASLAQALELEEAMPIMEEAAAKSEDGKLYASLAAVYLNAEKFNESVTAAKKAIQKGVKETGQVYIYMSTAYMQMEKFDDALDVLKKVDRDDKAQGYVNTLRRYIKTEQKRIAELKKAKAQLM